MPISRSRCAACCDCTARIGVPNWREASFDIGVNPVEIEIRVQVNPIVSWSKAALLAWPVWLALTVAVGILLLRRRRGI
jgi:hypothetical protein